ncbi:MAG TPA: twin-arginine translocase TatA/TatE family subunit [Chthoniobacteraceae bacterium]|nr:twin-arginine translocase TatA/TatE family subunit [Chthoniobacteraceae bacterium]
MNLASLFNLAGPDVLVILVVVLLLFGAKRLPELARGLGQAMNEFHKAKDDMQRQITNGDNPTVRKPSEIREHQTAPIAAQNGEAAPAESAPAAPAKEAQA